MTRTTTPRKPAARAATAKTATPPGFGGMLRGSMNSMMGTVGLNVPLRAIERLTSAIERAAALLERMERATRHLDRLDPRFVDRLDRSLTVLADMQQDTRAMRRRVDALEKEVRAMNKQLNERFDRLPLLRPGRRERRAADAGGG